MQVVVVPAHNDLNNPMQVAKTYIRGNGDAPPDRRLAVPQGNFEFINLQWLTVFLLLARR